MPNNRKREVKGKNIRSIAARLGEEVDLPPEGLPGNAQIELSGNRKAIVSGCRGVLEYDENTVRVSAGKLTVGFIGSDLCVSFYKDGEAVICGNIVNVEFGQ